MRPELFSFVINLDFEIGRKALMEKQLAGVGFPYEIVSAVNGKNLSPEYISRVYDETGAYAIQGKPLSQGEIGCALSHLSVYRRLIEKRLPAALVLEDDAYLHESISRLAGPLFDHIAKTSQPTIYLLTHLLRYRRKPVLKLGSTYSLHQIVDACCAHGYLINQLAAKAMLEAFDPIRYPIDAWKRIAEAGHIQVLGLHPYVVGHSVFAKESNIEVERLIVDDHFQPRGFDRLKFNLRFYLHERFVYQIWKLLAGIKKQHKQPWDLR